MQDDEKDEALAKERSAQWGIPFASKENKLLSMKTKDLKTLVPESFARRELVFPLFHANNVLTLAMADPDSIKTIESLELVTRMRIQPYISTKAQILAAIEVAYHDPQDHHSAG